MPDHEHKACPRCGKSFECKVGTVLQCQCSAIQLPESQREIIRSRYEDCLCIECLRELKALIV